MIGGLIMDAESNRRAVLQREVASCPFSALLHSLLMPLIRLESHASSRYHPVALPTYQPPHFSSLLK